jgi:predicted homoserine dehydrogenase-like protein
MNIEQIVQRYAPSRDDDAIHVGLVGAGEFGATFVALAGGVFAVIEAPDEATGRLFAAKGMPTCPQGRHVLLHDPVHPLGAEAAMSILSALWLGCSTGGVEVRPIVDLVASAARDLEPGEVFAMGGGT